MPDGTIKRGDTDPIIEITVNDSDGSAYDFTDCRVKAIMYYPTTLSETVDNSTTTISLPGSTLSIVEDGDLLVIDPSDNTLRERMSVTTAATVVEADTFADQTVAARPYSIPATAGIVYGSDYVDGLGTNIFILGTNAVFSIGYDGNTVEVATVTAASTSTNYLMSHLVTDVQTAVDAAITGGKVVVSSVGNRLVFTSATTGTASQVKITSPDAIATAELGITATEDHGESAVACTAHAHTTGAVINVIKFERDAEIYDADSGILRYNWQEGDTDIISTFYFEFEVQTPQGRYFTIPYSTSTITVQVITDANMRKITDGI